MVRELKKSCACVGCDFIDVKRGFPCNRCPRQKLDQRDMHSAVDPDGFVIDSLGSAFSFNGSKMAEVVNE